MLEALLSAFYSLIEPGRLAYLLAGVLLGLVVGVLPGLGGVVGLSLVLPFIYGMDPYSGIALLIGVASSTTTSDMFPSVLLGVPGSAASQATIMDGYPLAQRGEALRAFGAGLSASMVGGVVGAVVLTACLLIAKPLILALGSPELLMLSLLGLSMVGILSAGKVRLGLLSGSLGLLLGSIGSAPSMPVYRYTFDALYLYDGLAVVTVALGLFALPEILELVVTNRSISREGKLEGNLRSGIADVYRRPGLVLRSSALGSAIGFVPGLGGAVVDWITYGVAKRTSRNSHTFGTGDIRGVIAPESAASAKEGGALIPTLLFGIPGSGSMAVLLGAFTLLGIQAGPEMVGSELDITYTIIWAIALANIMGTAICLLLVRYIAKIAVVPGRPLFGFIVVVLVVAAYQNSMALADIWVFLLVALLGVLMKAANWPRAPLLIGFVLSGSVERYLHLSVSLYAYDWIYRPGVMVIGILTLVILLGGSVAKGVRRRLTSPSGGAAGSYEHNDDGGRDR